MSDVVAAILSSVRGEVFDYQVLMEKAIDDLNIDAAREDVSRFVRNPGVLDVWSGELF